MPFIPLNLLEVVLQQLYGGYMAWQFEPAGFGWTFRGMWYYGFFLKFPLYK